MNPPRMVFLVAALLPLAITVAPREARAQPQVKVAPPSVDFGVVLPGARNTQKVTITNAGNQPLSLTSLALEDVSGMFLLEQAPPTPLSLAAGQVVTLVITFQALLEGSFSATLALTTNDPMARNVRVPVNGVAAVGSFSLAPPALLFPATPVGLPSPSLLTIINTGKVALDFCGAAISGPNADQFVLTAPAKFTLQPGMSQAVAVQYLPRLAGVHSATASVTMCQLTPVQSSLSGTGVAADLAVAPAPRDLAMAPDFGLQPGLADRGCAIGRGRSSATPTASVVLALLLGLMVMRGARRRGWVVLGIALGSTASLTGCTPTGGGSGGSGGGGGGSDLQRVVHAGVVMLEGKRDAEFLDRYMIPYQRRQLYSGMTAEQQVEKFRRVAAHKLLARLKAAEKLEPKVNDSRTEATYALEPDLRFIRVDGIWRIAD